MDRLYSDVIKAQGTRYKLMMVPYMLWLTTGALVKSDLDS